jgi:hypothetical protein
VDKALKLELEIVLVLWVVVSSLLMKPDLAVLEDVCLTGLIGQIVTNHVGTVDRVEIDTVWIMKSSVTVN